MQQATVKLRPFFTYFGGKYRAAPRYPAPQHDRIIEPFAGSAGYSLRYPERDVLLVDLNPAVMGTWEYLINASPEEILALPLYDGSWRDLDDLGHLPQGARWLMGWWLNKGTVSPCKTPSAWMRKGDGSRTQDFWGPGIRQRIAEQVPQIRHWETRLASYQSIENEAATWFIDPPYQAAGKKYPNSSRAIDFSHLADWSKSREGQAIVCENHGADWLPFYPFRDIKAMAGSSRTGVSKEVIWTREIHDAEVKRWMAELM